MVGENDADFSAVAVTLHSTGGCFALRYPKNFGSIATPFSVVLFLYSFVVKAWVYFVLQRLASGAILIVGLFGERTVLVMVYEKEGAVTTED